MYFSKAYGLGVEPKNVDIKAIRSKRHLARQPFGYARLYPGE